MKVFTLLLAVLTVLTACTYNAFASLPILEAETHESYVVDVRGWLSANPNYPAGDGDIALVIVYLCQRKFTAHVDQDQCYAANASGPVDIGLIERQARNYDGLTPAEIRESLDY